MRGVGYINKAMETEKRLKWISGVDAAFAWDDVVEFYLMTPEQADAYGDAWAPED